MHKKILSMILAIAMVVSMFAGITVTASAAETVTLTFEGGTGSNQETWTFADEASGVTAEIVKGTHTTSPRLDASLIRIYGTADMSNVLTVSGPVGSTITSIAFTMGTSYNDLSKVTADSGALDNSEKTWTGSASSVSFTTAAQWRINSITVTYEASACEHAEYTTETTAATCTEAGKNVNTCTACGVIWEEEIAVLGHTVTEWTVSTDATCTAKGEKTGLCSVCEETVIEEIAATGHNNGDPVVTAPTCIDKGYTTVVCSVCGSEKKSDEVPALGHNFENGICTVCSAEEPAAVYYVLLTDASKLAEGDKLIIVSNKGEAKVAMSTTQNSNNRGAIEVTPNADGTITGIDGVQVITLGNGEGAWSLGVEDGYLNATNTTSSNYLRTTAEVDQYGYFSIEIDAEGIATVKAINKTSRNLMRYNGAGTSSLFACYSSGQNDIYIYREADEGEVCAHANTEEIAEVAATCTTAGATAGVKCNDCGVIISGCEEVAALGHSYEESITEATCGEAGEITNTCPACGDVQTTEIPATGVHNFEDGECLECGAVAEKYILTNALADGDKVIIYNPSAGKAMDKACTNDTTRYKVGTVIAPVDGVIETVNGAIVWTVAAVEGGFSLTNEDGQVLSIEGTYNSIPYDKENITWTLATAATDSCVYINNANGKQLYYGTSYDNFSAHDPLNYTEAEHAMQVYVLNGKGMSCAHAWDDGVVTDDPTCTETGKTVYTCTLCGETKEEAIDAVGHQYFLGYINADSMTRYMCPACNYVSDPCYIYNKVDTIANGDTVVIGCSSGGLTATASGTKLARAYGEYSFYNYFEGAMLAVETPAQALTVGYDEATGYYTFSYNDGTQDLYLTTGATGSTLSFAALDETTNLQKWVLEAGEGYYYIKNAEAAYSGNAQYLEYYNAFTTYKLGNGGYAYEMNFFAAAPSNAPACETNHANTTVFDAVAATCTEYGYSGDTVCSDCSFVVTYGTSVAPLDHSYGEGVADPEATCVDAGVMTYTCVSCGDVKTEEIPATGEHNYVDGTCTVCGATESVTPPVTGDTYYAKVTTAPETWDGNYIIVYEDGKGNAYIFNGVDAADTYYQTTYANGIIAYSAEVEANEVMIAAMEGGYSIKTANGYLYGTSGTNGTKFATDPALNTIEFNADGDLLITSNTSVFRFNNSNNNGMRFRYYKSSSYAAQQSISLYTKVAGETTECEHANTETQNAADPTCTEAGYTGDTVCLDCGLTVETGAEIAANGHTYVDGVCACGEKNIVDNSNLTVSMSITVGAEMQVLYTVLNSKVKTYKSFYIEVVKEVAGGESITTVFSIANGNMSERLSASGSLLGYTATYTGIYAMEMGDNFTATLYAVSADGTTINRGVSTTSSIKSFLYESIEGNNIAELKTLAVDMLNYGAAAQLFFAYDTENLVNADLTEEQLALGTQGLPEATNNISVSATGGNVTTSVTLQSKVVLYVNCTYTTTENSNLQFVVKNATTGEELSRFAPSRVIGRICQGVYDNVGASQMRDLIQIELYDNGELVSKTLTWSVESYVAQTRESSASSAELVATVNAMLVYGDSAAIYLEATGQ